MPIKKEKRKLFYYDWSPSDKGEKRMLNFTGMLAVDSKKSPGILRMFSRPGTKSDPLCQLYWGERLDPKGKAYIDALKICGPAPKDFVIADRFDKSQDEHD